MENFTHAGLDVRIGQDECAMSPEDNGDDQVFIVTTDNRHFEVKRSGFDCHTVGEEIQDGEYNGYKVYPLNAYIHSGVALSLGKSYPFDCPWDSGQIGFVLVSKTLNPGKEDEVAQLTVEEWNQFLSGDVWFFSVLKDDIVLESCGGFYGYENAVNEAKQVAQYVADDMSIADKLRFGLNRVLTASAKRVQTAIQD